MVEQVTFSSWNWASRLGGQIAVVVVDVGFAEVAEGDDETAVAGIGVELQPRPPQPIEVADEVVAES